jgi:NADH dehydrogenase
MAPLPHVVILGAGFGGMGVVQKLRDAPVRVTIIDRHDYQTFQPLLYQLATDELSPADVAHPVRETLHRHANATFHQAVVHSIDLASKRVVVDGMEPLDYDYLVLALGAVVSFHGVPGAAEHALPLYSLPDALKLREHVLKIFEEVDKQPALVDQGALNFCIVGGGATGVELAGALAEMLHVDLAADYPQMPVDQARIILCEHSPHVLGPFKENLRAYAEQALVDRGVHVRTSTDVKEIRAGDVTLANGEVLKTHTLIWAAGLQGNPLAGSLGIPLVAGGRIAVGDDLQVAGHPGVFAIGDIALATDAGTGKPLPGLGAVALQAGKHVGETISRLAEGKPAEPFKYVDKGTMATIGRGAAVVELPFGKTLTGTVAWLAWLGVHLSLLSGTQEKTSVFLEWGWNLLTRKRGKRIILNDSSSDTASE